MPSRNFSSESPNKPHLVRDGKGGVAGEVGDLRSDIEDAFAATDAEVDAFNPGVPMQNRLRALGAPGILGFGEEVVIGGDTYEFNANSPPDSAGGGGGAATVGSIWVYVGADSLAGRTNLVAAINNVGGAPEVTYDGAVTENMLAELDPVTIGDVGILSADAPGGSPVPSATATACTTTLGTGTDIWDSATMRFGRLATPVVTEKVLHTLVAADIAKGTLEVFFPFTPTRYTVVNRNRLHNEAVAIVGDALSLTLAGGGDPNNQPGDALEFTAYG